MRPKVKWTLAMPCAPIKHIALCLSQEEFNVARRTLGLSSCDWMGSKNAHATTWTFEAADGDRAYVVTFRPPEDATPVQHAALLVHEAVHIWQSYIEEIGEDEPGAEQEAYAIQVIAQALMDAYANRLKEAASFPSAAPPARGTQTFLPALRPLDVHWRRVRANLLGRVTVRQVKVGNAGPTTPPKEFLVFVKYIHLERYSTDEVDGITLGRCHVFPKLDGTNASVWLDDDGGYDDGLTMFCGSRNRILTLADDNQGFANWAITHTPLRSLLYTLPRGSRVYGEWLVPHTIKAYREDAWRRFYVFDVLTPAGEFMHYDEYMPLCKAHGVDFIPAMLVGNNPTYDVLHIEAQNNKFLMQENQGHGEGVVIKQYGWKNRFGRTVWAKLVTNTFKDAHVAEMGGKTINTTMVEEQIANEFVTQHMVDKIVAKIRVEHGSFSAQRIPQLLGMAFHDLVTEELWQAIKQHKNPKIDFKALNTFAIARVKTLLPELFGVRK